MFVSWPVLIPVGICAVVGFITLLVLIGSNATDLFD